MKLPFATPVPALDERAEAAEDIRDLASAVARARPHAVTEANGEEIDHGPTYPANFTKGLAHDAHGLLANPADYRAFVKAINAEDEPDLFDTALETAESRAAPNSPFGCRVPQGDCLGEKELADRDGYTLPSWRGWESPRAGHAYDLEGPDAGAVGMAPAPRVGSSELAAEMAEVYAMALLRDVPFATIDAGGDTQIGNKGNAVLSADQVVDALAKMPFFSGQGRVSSTPDQAEGGLNRFEKNRRLARTQSLVGGLTPQNLFRGSSPGVEVGPYVSQFMLVGGHSRAGGPKPASTAFPGTSSQFGVEQGLIRYGAQMIDQRLVSHEACLDYMTTFQSWLDVQNGANVGGIDRYEDTRRFITTPRDLATYVHFDELYQAYLNACLLLLSFGTPTSKGFPEPSPAGRRTPFATFGGPHILSLVTEVATRCLKAVRRQKFSYHRRARPEALGGRLTLAKCEGAEKLGCAASSFDELLAELPDDLVAAIIKHNAQQNDPKIAGRRRVICDCEPKKIDDCNLLLPMAFPEGSPMHPAYGAGHATVAGGCVTMLKAFFEMFEDCDSRTPRQLRFPCSSAHYFVPNDDGTALIAKNDQPLTIQGELNKLAANISIARNMAGVHYYTDYYDSARMGERIAVGILLEQSITYGDEVEMTFDSFDGDRITIAGRTGSTPSLTVLAADGTPVDPRDWWLRHVPGEAIIQP